MTLTDKPIKVAVLYQESIMSGVDDGNAYRKKRKVYKRKSERKWWQIILPPAEEATQFWSTPKSGGDNHGTLSGGVIIRAWQHNQRIMTRLPGAWLSSYIAMTPKPHMYYHLLRKCMIWQNYAWRNDVLLRVSPGTRKWHWSWLTITAAGPSGVAVALKRAGISSA